MSQFIRQIYQKNNSKYKKAVFLDRDGTLNKEVNYLSNKTQIEILPTVIEGIQILNKQNYLTIVITNQPVVAKGLIDISELKKINNSLYSYFKKQKAYIDAIYSCPHHPNADVKKYQKICECRKPGLAMFQRAMHDYDLQRTNACIIGDRTSDIKAGEGLRIPTYLVRTDYTGLDNTYQAKPTHIFNSFLDAVKLITKL